MRTEMGKEDSYGTTTRADPLARQRGAAGAAMIPEYSNLLQRYAHEVKRFKAFCEGLAPETNEAAFGETDFYDLSVGFFIALGVTGSEFASGEDDPFSDAHRLATVCRYTFGYWTP